MGHGLTSSFCSPLVRHSAPISAFPQPSDKPSLQRFLGTINFYRKFLRSAAQVLAPLTDALKGPGKTISWTPLMNSAFNRAKQLLSAVPELVHPQSNAAISLFSIFTDHKPLTHSLFRTSPPWSARQQRHLAYLAEFTSSIVHIPGKENVVADALSHPVSPVSSPSFTPG